MKKIRKAFTRKITSGIGITGVMIMLLLYVFVYMKYSQLTRELEASNIERKNSLVELKEYYDNMEKYEKESKGLEEAIEELMAEYPADAREEDVIMLAVNTQEKHLLSYDNINMMEPALIYAVPQSVAVKAAMEGYEQEIGFMEKQAAYTNITDYENLKGIIEQIYKTPNRIAINNISYAVTEESELLEGMLNLSFYIVTGTDKEYTPPDIDEYISGTDNPFQQRN